MNEFENTYQQSEVKTLNSYINDTFKWLMLGIVVTFVTAFTFEKSNIGIVLFSNPLMLIAMVVIELGVALYFGTRLFKLNPFTAKMMYLIYAFITGITFSAVLTFYTTMTVSMAFLLSAIFFGVLVLFGTYTKIDLTKIGHICFIGLFVYIIYAVLAMIFNWGQFLLPFISLALFTGITAYDMQKTIRFYYQFQNDTEMIKRLSIFSAFSLYLDIINIFLDILRILGDSD